MKLPSEIETVLRDKSNLDNQAYLIAKRAVQRELVKLRSLYPLIQYVHASSDGCRYWSKEGLDVLSIFNADTCNSLKCEDQVADIQAMADEFARYFSFELGPIKFCD